MNEEKKIKKLETAIAFDKLFILLSSIVFGTCFTFTGYFIFYQNWTYAITCACSMICCAIHIFVFHLYVKMDEEEIEILEQIRRMKNANY